MVPEFLLRGYELLRCKLFGHHSLIVQPGVGVQCLDCGRFWSDKEWFSRKLNKEEK